MKHGKKKVKGIKGKGPETGTRALIRSIRKGSDRSADVLNTPFRGFIESKDVVREYLIISTVAMVIGILAGLGAVIFRYMIFGAQVTFFFGGTPIDNDIGWLVLIVPAVGGLIVGLLIKYSRTPETRGHGVPEVIFAASKKGGRMKPRVVLIQAVASSICIGSGGSVGREGPIVQIGAAIGSTLGQSFSFLRKNTRIFLACGGAAAIAAAFNTPIAGVVFALEIILIEMKTKSFIPLVISSVFATIISRKILGDHPAFEVPTYTLANNWEFLAYLLLGLLAGFIAVIFILVLNRLEILFERVPIPAVTKPLIGGLAIGTIALAYPQIMGIGYDTVDMVFAGEFVFVTLVILVLLKLMATSITIGSGGAGGVFAPSLFIGACLGGALGILMKDIAPFDVGPVGAYALVGMAALLAGTTRGTLTAIILIFEMTRAYEIILPLMFACVISDAVAHLAIQQSIFTIGLKKRGVNVSMDMAVNIMDARTVEDCMSKDLVKVNTNGKVKDVLELFETTGKRGFPVVDDEDKLMGIVTYDEISDCVLSGELDVPISKRMVRNPIVATPTETLKEVVHRMFVHKIHHIPVVDPDDRVRVVGMITRQDIMDSIASASMEED